MKKVWIIWLISLLTSFAHGGFLSELTKVGKAARHVDVDVPLHKLKLPEGLHDKHIASLRPREGGEWILEGADGQLHVIKTIEDVARLQPAPHALLLDARDLPGSLKHFENLPDSLPILLKTKNDAVFTLRRPTGVNPKWELNFSNIDMPVADITQLQSGLWHLQRPWKPGQISFREIGSASDSLQETLAAMSTMSRKTLVVAGNQLPDASRILLKAQAETHGIQLIMLDAPNPTKVLAEAQKHTEAMLSGSLAENHTAGFLQQFAGLSDERFIYQLSQGQGSQSLIQTRPVPNLTAASDTGLSIGDVAAHTAKHIVVKSIVLAEPNEARGQELDQRIVPFIPTYLQTYLIISGFLGFLASLTTWRAWNAIWRLHRPEHWQQWPLYLLLRPLHFALFLLVFLPVAGGWCFAYVVFTTLWGIFYVLIVRPGQWILSMIQGNR